MIMFFRVVIFIFSFYKSQTVDQIQKAKSIIKKTGMSQEQVVKEAKARGYSDDQINSVIEKEKRKSSSNSKTIQNTNLIDPSFEIKDVETKKITTDMMGAKDNLFIDESIKKVGDDLELLEESELSIDTKSQERSSQIKYFGYDIFSRDPSFFQSTSIGVIDPDYLIGPEDEIIVMLWGETQFRQVLNVDREGFVFYS